MVDSLLPGSRLGRYQVVEQIGRGGMATVFKALDPQLNRHVAVKVLPSYHIDDPTFVERFRREAQAVASLNHANIVQVHDYGEDKGFTYIVMEHVTGGTLQDRLDRRLPLTEALDLISPLADALEAAHDKGIVHRDIKPSNVLMDAGGKPKLSDFGLSRSLEGSAGLTRSESVLGTPQYMAPEQALGRTADRRSDLYSMGILVYQLLLGRTPFRFDTPTETLMAHIHQPVPLPTEIDPDFDPRLEATLITALAKNPDQRYQTVSELMQALTSLTDVPGVEAELAELPTLEERLAKKRVPNYLFVAVAIALIGVAGGLWLLLSDGTEDAQISVGSTANEPTDPAPTQLSASSAPIGTITEGGTVALDLDSNVITILHRVSEVRELLPLEPIVPKFVPKEELRSLRLKELNDNKEELERDRILWTTLGLIPPEFDPYEFRANLITKGTPGPTSYYDAETREFYVVDDAAELTFLQEIDIVHQCTSSKQVGQKGSL